MNPNPNSLTPPKILHRNGSLKPYLQQGHSNIVVTSLRIEPIAELTCAGQLARLHLSFNRPQSKLPSRLVAKLQAPDDIMAFKFCACNVSYEF